MSNPYRVEIEQAGRAGRILVGGHNVSGITEQVTVSLNFHNRLPEVTLKLAPIATLARLDAAEFQVDAESRDALITLGWTPPSAATEQQAAPHLAGTESDINQIVAEAVGAEYVRIIDNLTAAAKHQRCAADVTSDEEQFAAGMRHAISLVKSAEWIGCEQR